MQSKKAVIECIYQLEKVAGALLLGWARTHGVKVVVFMLDLIRFLYHILKCIFDI